MSRRLILMRHAKSSWTSGASSDHARPLKGRGRRDAPRIAAALQERGWWPDVALVSDAMRTRETWDRMVEGRAEAEVRPERQLYLAGIDELRGALRGLGPEVGTALALGHNPGWEEALHWLCGVDTRLTTANAALLETDAETWPQALEVPGGFRLLEVLRPKTLSNDPAVS